MRFLQASALRGAGIWKLSFFFKLGDSYLIILKIKSISGTFFGVFFWYNWVDSAKRLPPLSHPTYIMYQQQIVQLDPQTKALQLRSGPEHSEIHLCSIADAHLFLHSNGSTYVGYSYWNPYVYWQNGVLLSECASGIPLHTTLKLLSIALRGQAQSRREGGLLRRVCGRRPAGGSARLNLLG